MGNMVLEVRSLAVRINNHGISNKVLDGVAFEINKGEVFGLVGESGSGKTMTALSILKLLPRSAVIEAGDILFCGENVLTMAEDRLRRIRGGSIAMVFQEPSTSLDPVFTVGYQIKEAVHAHQDLSDMAAKELAIEFLERVHIPEPHRIYQCYPHQLSGGTKQRIMIAMALINKPELLILDEPTTALDVTIQAQILDLLEEIISEEKVSALFISHDLGIISRMCGRVGVMYQGRIVESGLKDLVLAHPKDPYTISLIESTKALSR